MRDAVKKLMSQLIIQQDGLSDVILKLSDANFAAFQVYGWTADVAFQNFIDSTLANAAVKRRDESLQKLALIQDIKARDDILAATAVQIDAQIEKEKPKP